MLDNIGGPLHYVRDRVAIRKGFRKKWAVWDHEDGRTERTKPGWYSNSQRIFPASGFLGIASINLRAEAERLHLSSIPCGSGMENGKT